MTPFEIIAFIGAILRLAPAAVQLVRDIVAALREDDALLRVSLAHALADYRREKAAHAAADASARVAGGRK